jgi:hypothetical protein
MDQYKEAMESEPDAVIFMFGTNDSWYWNWGWSEETNFQGFQKNYINLVKKF